MGTASYFNARVSIQDLIAPAKSVGAHLAAKLDCFFSDERTLTDELCDMFCIWLAVEISARRFIPALTFDLRLAKTTPAEESECGADLELIVGSPLGIKRCLLQAKVVDPQSLRLRYDSKKGWKKLRQQLKDARNEVGDLAYLLVYVPARLLDRQQFGFGSYEQAFSATAPTTHKESYFGATVIPVSELLGPTGRWRSTKYKVRREPDGSFKGEIPFWRFLLELFLCWQGKWSDSEAPLTDERFPPFRRFVMTASGISVTEWSEMQTLADQFLAQRNTERG
jgi:hypothetical protein